MLTCNPHEEKLVPNYEGEVRISSPQNPIARWLRHLLENRKVRAFRSRLGSYVTTEKEMAKRINALLEANFIGELRISLQSDEASESLAYYLGVNLQNLNLEVKFLDSRDVKNTVDSAPLHPSKIPGVFHFKLKCAVMKNPGQGIYHRISWLSPVPEDLRKLGFKDREICMVESVGPEAINEVGHRLAIFMMQIMEARLRSV